MSTLLLYAMQAEANPLLQLAGANPVPLPAPPWLPFRLYRGQLDGREVHALVSGIDARYDVDNIGLEAATLMAYVAIDALKPGLVVSCGTAGGFAAHGAQVGTVYLADTFLFHDRHVPLPGFRESALSITRTFDAGLLAERLALERVTVSSGSSLQRAESDIAVMLANDVRAKEMEVAAIAWVCQLAGMPLLAVKSVTNLLDHPDSSEAQFERHFGVAVDALTAQVRRVLAALP